MKFLHRTAFETVRKLQLVQNAATSVLTGASKFQHITPILWELYWLLELVLTYKALYSLGPGYHLPSCARCSIEEAVLVPLQWRGVGREWWVFCVVATVLMELLVLGCSSGSVFASLSSVCEDRAIKVTLDIHEE